MTTKKETPKTELMSFAQINRNRKENDVLELSQGDKNWFKRELQQLAYCLDLTKEELMSLVNLVAEDSPTRPKDFPKDADLDVEQAKAKKDV